MGIVGWEDGSAQGSALGRLGRYIDFPLPFFMSHGWRHPSPPIVGGGGTEAHGLHRGRTMRPPGAAEALPSFARPVGLMNASVGRPSGEAKGKAQGTEPL